MSSSQKSMSQKNITEHGLMFKIVSKSAILPPWTIDTNGKCFRQPES